MDEEPVGVPEETVTSGKHWLEDFGEIGVHVNGPLDKEGGHQPEGGDHAVAMKWLPCAAEARDCWHWIVREAPQAGVAAVRGDVAGERDRVGETEVVPAGDGPLVVAFPPFFALVAVAEGDFGSAGWIL